MEDVNNVPPSSIAARKPTPLHREKISDNDQISVPWQALVAKQFSRKDVAADKANITALDKALEKLIKRRVWAIDPAKGEVCVNMTMLGQMHSAKTSRFTLEELMVLS